SGSLAVDFGPLLILGILWVVFSLLGRKRSGDRPGPRSAPQRPETRPQPPIARQPTLGDATQQEGSRLERLLRELERNLEQAGGTQARPPARPPLPALPDDEEVEDRRSHDDEPVRVVSLETEVTRPERARYSQDADAEELVRRRIAEAEARSGSLTVSDHKAFDSRIRQEPADHTAVRRYTTAQLRDAIVWREILGPPVSERDPRSP
ncbi:MAG: hypothetical protein ACREM9_02415, partial [Gemmatimonadales bacterium]